MKPILAAVAVCGLLVSPALANPTIDAAIKTFTSARAARRGDFEIDVIPCCHERVFHTSYREDYLRAGHQTIDIDRNPALGQSLVHHRDESHQLACFTQFLTLIVIL